MDMKKVYEKLGAIELMNKKAIDNNRILMMQRMDDMEKLLKVETEKYVKKYFKKYMMQK